MYRMPKKAEAGTSETVPPRDCFVEKTKSWLWAIVVIVVGCIVYAIVTSSGQEPVYSSASQPLPQGGQFQNAALTRCPYCTGFLDAQGRCNVSDCPIYSLNRGKISNLQSIPVRQVLIKELALEVSAMEGKGSVVIHSVYGGGRGEKAGLRAGDRICRFNGRKVKDVKQFQSVVGRARPESDIKIQVIRNEKEIESVVRIGEGQMEGVTIPNTLG